MKVRRCFVFPLEKKDCASTGSARLDRQSGDKREKHVFSLTLPECRIDRSIARVELVSSPFEPRPNNRPPLSKGAGNFNAADWDPQER